MSAAVRPLYWSIRRELWENRSLIVAPLIVTALILFGFMISTVRLPGRTRALAAKSAAAQQEAVTRPYNTIAGMLMATAFIVGAFYCLDAVHGERRDRSLLFWKSLPVSDRTAMTGKLAIPLVVLPTVVLVLSFLTRIVMLFFSTVRLLGDPASLGRHWTYVKFTQSMIALVYALLAIALWHAPIYAWFLLVSSWAKRAVILWAVLPSVVLCVLERITSNTSWLSRFFVDRMVGWFPLAFDIPPATNTVAFDPLSRISLGHYLGSGGLWFGLIAAAAFFAVTIRLRRTQEPI
jgi:ABC-2 type transport system permease protein